MVALAFVQNIGLVWLEAVVAMGLEIFLSMEASLAMLGMGNLVALLLVETCGAMEVLVVATQRLSRVMELKGVQTCIALVELELWVHLPLLLDKQLTTALFTAVGAMDSELQRVVMVQLDVVIQGKALGLHHIAHLFGDMQEKAVRQMTVLAIEI